LRETGWSRFSQPDFIERVSPTCHELDIILNFTGRENKPSLFKIFYKTFKIKNISTINYR
jgi:hypothetical protein